MKPTANRHQPSHRHPSFLYSYDFTYKDKMAEENVPTPTPTRMSVFGKSIPKELITEVIQNSSYYQQYLEIVARKPTAKEGGQKKTAFEAEKPKKPTPVKKPEPAKQTKPVKEKSTKPAPSMKTRKGKVSQSLLELQKPKGKSTTDQYIFQRRIPVTKKASTRPSTQLKDDTSANIVHETPSPPDAETGVEAEMSNSKGDTEILNVGEEKGEDVSNTMALEERTVELDEGQARSDPGNTLESQPPPDEDQAGSNPGQSHVALARPNPKPMQEDFIVIVYPKVHKSLKHTTKEHVFLENPPSSTGTLSSMKNLDDAFTFGDQFIDDKSPEDEPGKATRTLKLNQSESLFHLAEEDHRLGNLKFVPKGEDDEVFRMEIPNELITNNIRNTPYYNAYLEMVAKHDQKIAAEEVRGAYTQRTLVGDTNIIADLEEEQKDPLSSFTNLSSMKNLDDAYNIGDQFIDDKLTEDEPGKLNVESEIVYMVTVPVYQADTSVPPLSTLVIEIATPISPYPVHRQPNHYSNNRFSIRKEEYIIRAGIHQPKQDYQQSYLQDLHTGASRSGNHTKHADLYKALERSMARDNMDEFIAEKAKSQKRRRNDQDPPQPSPKKSDQKDKPESPEPDWTVPSNDLPELENNWANALAKSYKDPAENKLLQKTGDMGPFIKWFCKRLGKKQLSKSDLEGPTFKVVKAFHKKQHFPAIPMEEVVTSFFTGSS
ncbi:hypothetical protein Tco_0280854 [Tanacetum coccineum]